MLENISKSPTDLADSSDCLDTCAIESELR